MKPGALPSKRSTTPGNSAANDTADETGVVTHVYKLLSANAWEMAKADGRFAGSEVDIKDGYMHFSTADQLAETARRHFGGQRDLVCLAVDSDQMQALKWEPSRGGALFPHLYSTLETERVVGVWAIPLGPDGAPDITEVTS